MKPLLRYFDLNARATNRVSGSQVASDEAMLQAAGNGQEDPRIPLWEQMLMYFGILIGVLFSSAATQFKSNSPKPISFTMGTIAVSMVIAFVVVPAAFEKLQIKPDSPLIVRFGIFVQHGVFWNVLFTAAGKALGP